MLELNRAYNMDCMEGMAQFPDKYFEWAIVDPPYGDAGRTFLRADASRFGGRFDKYKDAGQTGADCRPVSHAYGTRFKKYQQDPDSAIERRGGGYATKYGRDIISWDVAPDDEYFNELFRVSKNQIIWGGNYFGLPPNRCFLIWHKTNIPEKFSMAMAEYAWCSMNENAKVFSYTSNRSKDEDHFHPTEKPVALYAWIIRTFVRPGEKIIDTHLGSGSSRIAAHDAHCPFIGFEIDPAYYAKQEERFAAYTAQLSLFDVLAGTQTTLNME